MSASKIDVVPLEISYDTLRCKIRHCKAENKSLRFEAASMFTSEQVIDKTRDVHILDNHSRIDIRDIL